MTPSEWVSIGQAGIWFFGSGAAVFFSMKYAVQSTADKVQMNLEKLDQHIEDDKKAFAEIGEKLDTTIGLLNAHNVSLNRHDERAANMDSRIERVEQTLGRIEERVTDLRVATARKG